MNESLTLSGKSEFKGRNGYAALHVISGLQVPASHVLPAGFQIDFSSKRVGNAPPARLALTLDDARALKLWFEKLEIEPADPREVALAADYRARAREDFAEEGTLEIDDNAIVSMGDDKGAYVAAWVWVADEDDDEDQSPIGDHDCAVSLCFQPADEGETLCVAHKDTNCPHGLPLAVKCADCEKPDDRTEPVFVCQNCESRWIEDELKPIKDFGQRVAAGEPMPAGECPECGALCHSDERAGEPGGDYPEGTLKSERARMDGAL